MVGRIKITFRLFSVCRGDQWSPAFSPLTHSFIAMPSLHTQNFIIPSETFLRQLPAVIPSVAEESRGNEPLGLITAIAIIRKTSLIDLYANFFTFSRRFFSVFIFVKKRG